MPWLTGYPREEIDWFPTIDPDKCTKCGMCMNCGRSVFVWTKDGARVAEPYACIVGCSTCWTLCEGEAISFPDPGSLRELYEREKIWPKVKDALRAQGKLEIKEAP